MIDIVSIKKSDVLDELDEEGDFSALVLHVESVVHLLEHLLQTQDVRLLTTHVVLAVQRVLYVYLEVDLSLH